MICVGCNKRGLGCSRGCLDYLLESLTQPKETTIKSSKNGVSFVSRQKRNHTYLGGK